MQPKLIWKKEKTIKLPIQENNVNDMLKQTKLLYEGNTSVVNFNRNNLFCKL